MHNDTLADVLAPERPKTAQQTRNIDSEITATAPGQIRVIKRNGTLVPYDDSKIAVAIAKAFLAVEGGPAAASSRIHETVQQLSEQITNIFKRRLISGGTVHIEEIQDQVELALMRNGEHKVARAYVLYREAQAQKRASRQKLTPEGHAPVMITRADGSQSPLDLDRLAELL